MLMTLSRISCKDRSSRFLRGSVWALRQNYTKLINAVKKANKKEASVSADRVRIRARTALYHSDLRVITLLTILTKHGLRSLHLGMDIRLSAKSA
jgi:hypothetical protein